jgi:hypothetical protein
MPSYEWAARQRAPARNGISRPQRGLPALSGGASRRLQQTSAPEAIPTHHRPSGRPGTASARPAVATCVSRLSPLL